MDILSFFVTRKQSTFLRPKGKQNDEAEIVFNSGRTESK